MWGRWWRGRKCKICLGSGLGGGGLGGGGREAGGRGLGVGLLFGGGVGVGRWGGWRVRGMWKLEGWTRERLSRGLGRSSFGNEIQKLMQILISISGIDLVFHAQG